VVWSADFLSAAMFLFNLLMLLLLSDTLMRVVSGGKLRDNGSYQTCITSPSTCVRLCVPSSPSLCPPRLHECRAVLARGNERSDTLPLMAVTVLPRRRSCAGETRVAPRRTALSRCG
jgi:hypothetical protein